jgi:putative transposase
VIVDFIREHADHREPGGLRWGVAPICAVLTEHGCRIAPSTFYEWKDKLPTRRQSRDAALLAEVRRVYNENFQVYGARKIWLQLNREGFPVARCTVERLMAAAGLRGAHRGQQHKTTIPDPAARPATDLVHRQFEPVAPNRLWVADVTYVSTWSGWAYTAFVTDAFARRILGWQVSTTMTTALVLDALDQAIWARDQEHHNDRARLVAHSDHGSQYTSLRYGERLAEARIQPSTGTVADSYDNALAETINGLYKTELIKRHGPWRTVDQLAFATAEWVEWYNHRRIYEYCGDLSPVACENLHYDLHNPTRITTGTPN